MLRATGVSAQWHNRTGYAYRRGNPRGNKRMVGGIFKQWFVDPDIAMKHPEERKDIWDKRVTRGHVKVENEDFKAKWKGRREHRMWPHTGWDRDPVRNHASNDTVARSRCVNAAVAQFAVAGRPQFDHYKEARQDYSIDDDAPLPMLADVLLTYVGTVWSREQLAAYLTQIDGVFPGGPAAIHAKADEVEAWNNREFAVPIGLLEHLALLCRDVCRQNSLKAYRRRRQAQGVLRMPDQTQYYALPAVDGPAMPASLAQPSGNWSKERGEYTWGVVDKRTHPLFVPDYRRRVNYRPA